MTSSIDFFNHVSHLRSPFLAIRKCETPPHAIADGAYGRLKNIDFPMSRMSRHRYIKALLPVQKKRERGRENPFAGQRHTNVLSIFLSRTVVAANGERTDKLYGVCRDDEGTSEDEIANQKGALKVVDALVARSNAIVARKDSPGIL